MRNFILKLLFILLGFSPCAAYAGMDDGVNVVAPAPWLVTLYEPGETPDKDRSFCQGVVVSSRWIMTAAHCVVEKDYTHIKADKFVTLTYDSCDLRYANKATGDCKSAGGFGRGVPVVRLGLRYDPNTEAISDIDISSVAYPRQMAGYTIILPNEEDPKYGEGEVFYLDDVIIHPDYGDSEIDGENDIALVRVRSSIPSDRIASLAGTTVSVMDLSSGSSIVVAGWGNTQEICNEDRTQCHSQAFDKKTAVWDLPKVGLRVVDKVLCDNIRETKKREYNKKHNLGENINLPDPIGPNRFCAWDKSRDVCHGDSGSGVFSPNWERIPSVVDGRFYILGLVSSGPDCNPREHVGLDIPENPDGSLNIPDPTADDPEPGVYTTVAPYIDWIQSVIGEEKLHLVGLREVPTKTNSQ